MRTPVQGLAENLLHEWVNIEYSCLTFLWVDLRTDQLDIVGLQPGKNLFVFVYAHEYVIKVIMVEVPALTGLEKD